MSPFEPNRSSMTASSKSLCPPKSVEDTARAKLALSYGASVALTAMMFGVMRSFDEIDWYLDFERPAGATELKTAISLQAMQHICSERRSDRVSEDGINSEYHSELKALPAMWQAWAQSHLSRYSRIFSLGEAWRLVYVEAKMRASMVAAVRETAALAGRTYAIRFPNGEVRFGTSFD